MIAMTEEALAEEIEALRQRWHDLAISDAGVAMRFSSMAGRIVAALRSKGGDDALGLLREARELLRQTANALAVSDKNDPNESIADNGMTVWDGMRSEHERLWPRSTDMLSKIDIYLQEQSR